MPPQGDGGMQFENQGEEFGAPPQEATGFDLTGKLVEWGLVSTRSEAQYALGGLALIALVIAAFLFFGFGGSGSSTPPPPPVA